VGAAAAILWLRRDLRRADLPALDAAAQAAGDRSVLVLYVLDPALWDGAGAARRAWLAANLRATRDTYDGRPCLRMGAVGAALADAGVDWVERGTPLRRYESARS
jgi:deoxyribodipyrimidine photo-lyase